MNLLSILTGFADKEPKQANRIECSSPCAVATIPDILPSPHNCSAAVVRQRRRSPERTLRRRKPRGCQSNLARSNLDGPSAAICDAICNAICKKTRAPLHKRFMALGLLLAGGLTSGLSFAQEVTTITPLSLTKSFATPAILAGETQTMTFTISNPNSRSGNDAFIFGIRFTDNLEDFLPGIEITTDSLPTDRFCSTPTSLSPPNATFSDGLLTVTGAELADGDRCEFEVEFIVPANLAPGVYTNTTSDLDQRTVSNEGNEIGITTPAASATMTIPEPAADLEVTVSDATDPIVAGANQVYTVTVTNNGPEDAPAVASTFTLPAGTTLVSTAGCAEDTSGVPTCTLGNIAASAAAEYTVTAAVDFSFSPSTITATATAASTGPNAVADDNAANDAGSASTEVLMATENTLTLTKSFGANPIEAGARQTMTFTISNPDDLTASETDRFFDILVQDSLSTFLGSAPGIDTNGITLPTAGFCGSLSVVRVTTNAVTDQVGLQIQGVSLNGGESCTIEVEFIVPSDLAPGVYTNTTSRLLAFDERIGSALELDFPAASATMTVVAAPADLAVTVTDATDPIVPGANQVYTVAVANNGPGDAPDVVSTFTLPEGATLVSTSGCAEDTSGVPTCTLGNIAASTSAGYTVTASINAATTSTINATATAASTGPNAVADENPANDTGSQDTAVTPSADISITKDDGVTSVNGGGTVTYSIVASNNGPSDDPAVTVADTFPPGLMNCTYTSVAAGGASGNTASGTGNLAETLSLPSGGEVTYTATCTVAVAATGTLSNTATATASVADPDNSNNSATDDDTVVTSVTIDFSKGFSPATVDQGATSTLTFTINNGANIVQADNMAFSNQLPAGLEVADTPAVTNSCGGTFTPVAGDTTLAFTGGTLNPGATCEIQVPVRAVAAGTLTNPGIDLTSSIATATSDAATLTVNAAGAPGFSKAFTPATIDVGATSTLTFSIDNTANAIDVTAMAFTDDFPDGLVIADTPNASNSCGGAFSPVAGATTLTFTGGALNAGATCEIQVTARTIEAGTLINPGIDLTSSIATASSAEAILTVTAAAAPGFSKAFAPATLDVGATSTLTFSIDNTANAIDVTAMAFTDDFPDGLVVADTPNASNSCGGAFSPVAGATTLTFTGGALDAGDTCEIQVTVRTIEAGTLINPGIDLTSSIATASSAVATLTVTAAAAPGFSKAFAPATLDVGATSTLTFSIDNTANAIDVTAMAFTDDFPDGLVVADTPNASNSCGGAFSPVAGATTLTFTGGALDAGDTCEIQVTVRTIEAGTLINPGIDLTSSIATASSAVATLTVTAAAAPGFSKAFAPATLDVGATSTLTFSIDNTANAIDVTAMAFTDDFPDGLVVADTPNASNSCGGAFSPVAGATTLTFTGGALNAGATCEIQVTVRTIEAGTLINPGIDLTSSIATASSAVATLTVTAAAAPGFSKAFAPATLDVGATSTLTFSIDNTANAIDVTAMAFTDDFPDGLVVADTPNASNSCGGAFSPVAGATTLTFTGGALNAGATCEIQVTVRTIEAGTLINPGIDLTSSIATATSNPATLTVNAAGAPGFTKGFSPATVDQGATSTLSFTIDNGANIVQADTLAFSDQLPAGLVVADTPGVSNSCGGTFSPAAGDTTLAFTGGALNPGATCEIQVTVRAIEAGALINPGIDLTSSIATATSNPATLTVNAAGAPGFTKGFSPATVDQGATSTLSFTIDNGANIVQADILAFSDQLPAGLVVADTPGVNNSCGGTFSPAAGDTTLAFTGGALNPGATCEIQVTVRAIEAGALINPGIDLTSSIATATSNPATLTVNAAGAPVFTKVFSPDTVNQGETSTLSFTIDNGANIVQADTLAFSDQLPAGLVVADTPGVNNSCGGTFSPAAGDTTLTFTDGTLNPGATCEIQVTVRAIEAGALINPGIDLTSSIATATSDAATLTVNAADAPGFSKVFSPDTINQGEETDIVFTINNAGNAIDMMAMGFTDPLPAGLVVADTPGVNNSCGGAFSPAAGDTTLTFTDGTLDAGATCEIQVTVHAVEAGTLINPGIDLTSSIATATSNPATLTVNAADAPGFSKVFSPDTINQGEETEIVFTINNAGNAIDMTAMGFTDPLPTGLVVADTPGVNNSCGGTFSPAAGDTTLTFTDGTLDAGATCEIQVTVRAIEAGTLINPGIDLTLSIATATSNPATLTVNAADAPGFSKVFSPDTINQGEETDIVFTINNAGNAIDMMAMGFTDPLPTGLVVADTPGAGNSCGGAFSPAAGDTTLTFTDGTLDAGATCEIQVTVRTIEAGALINPGIDLTSSIATATSNPATLTVNAADAPGFSKVFSPDTINQGEETEIVFTINNAGNAIDMTAMGFTDPLPTGLVVADTPGVNNSCGGTFSPAAGDTTLTFTDGTLNLGATCEIQVTVRAIEAGTLINPGIDLTSSIATATSNPATLTVNAADAPGFSKVFSPDTINQGEETDIVFTINNAGNAIDMMAMGFTDPLPTGLVVADTPGAGNSCGGAFSPAAGDTTLTFTDGTLDAGATCEIQVTVRAIEAGTLINPGIDLTSSIATATSNPATLTVNAADAPGFSKVFSPDTINQGEETEIVFTINNAGNAIDMTAMGFTDPLPTGLVVADTPGVNNSCGGTFSPAAGDTTLTFTDGTLNLGATCEIQVTVRAIEAGTLINPGIDLTLSIATATSNPATLTVNAADAPGFSKVFSPDTINQGEETDIVFTINNAGNAIDMMAMGFTDPLPTGLVVADTPGAGNSCGGAFSPAAGDTTLTFTDGTLDAGATCEIQVTVRTIEAGALINPGIDLTSSIATATSNPATLTVNAADAPGFSKVFSPDTINQGEETEIVFTINNAGNAIDMTAMGFTDPLPTGLVVADTPGVNNSCGGTFSPAAGDTTLTFTDGTLNLGATCEIQVTVRAIEAGTLINPGIDLTSSIATATSNPATLTVNAADAPGFSKVFSPDTINQGEETDIVFTINNAGNAIDMMAMGFTDPLPTGLVVADTPGAGNSCGGAFSPAAGDTTLTFTDGTLDAGATCEIQVTVRAIEAGTLINPGIDLTSSIATATSNPATLTVNAADAPGFSKVFSPDTINQGEETDIVFTINNAGNAIDMMAMGFTDPLPTGLVVADTPGAGNSCGGAFSPAAGDTTLTFTDGTLDAGATCEIQVTVRAIEAGTLINPGIDLTSSIATATSAEATLTVNAADAPGFSKVFSPDTINQGEETDIVFTINNAGNAIDVTAMGFTDPLPTGLVVADTPGAGNSCGGAFSPAAGDTTLTFTDGTLDAGATCEIQVTVRAIEAGTLINPGIDLTLSIATATSAEATLTVNAADAPGFSKVFSPDTINQGEETDIVFTINNAGNAIDVTAMGFTDPLPTGLVVADTPGAGNSCGGAFSPAAGDTTLTFTDGTLDAGATCEIQVTVRAIEAGTLINPGIDLTSSIATATSTAATLMVNQVPLSVSMVFEPTAIAQGEASRLSYQLDNSAAVAATAVALSDTLPTDVVVAAVPDAQTDCTAGTLTAPAGGSEVSLSGGELGVGATCTIAVDVTSATVGSYPNATQSVTSSLGASTPAEATLTVDAAAGTVTFNVESDTNGAFSFASAAPVLTTAVEVSGGAASTGALRVATGSYSVAVTVPAGVILTAITCDDTDSTADLSTATISVTVDAFEDVTCRLTAQSPVQRTVETINSFLTRRADLILSSEPNPLRRFDRLKRGSGTTSPVSFSIERFRERLLFTAQDNNVSSQLSSSLLQALGLDSGPLQDGNYRLSSSLLQVREAAASAGLALDPDRQVAEVKNYRFDAWFEAQYRKFDNYRDSDDDFGIAYFGADYLLTPDILVGAVLSLDRMRELTDTSEADGSGWMLGPYVTARLAPKLYFDGRLAAGTADNSVSPFNTYADDFLTGRWLAMSSLTGEFQLDNWTIQPHLSLSYFEETQKSYIDSVSGSIPSQTVRLGQMKIGPTITGRFEGSAGQIYSPYLTIDAIYNDGDTTGVTLTNTDRPDIEGWRARLKTGISVATESGTRFSLGVTRDGIGRSDSRAWGLTFEYSAPIGRPR